MIRQAYKNVNGRMTGSDILVFNFVSSLLFVWKFYNKVLEKLSTPFGSLSIFLVIYPKEINFTCVPRGLYIRVEIAVLFVKQKIKTKSVCGGCPWMPIVKYTMI